MGCQGNFLRNTKEYPNLVVPIPEFSGSQKWGIEGEVKRGKGVGEGTGPEGERGGKNEEKGWEERGPKAHSKNSDFGTPVISVLFSNAHGRVHVFCYRRSIVLSMPIRCHFSQEKHKHPISTAVVKYYRRSELLGGPK